MTDVEDLTERITRLAIEEAEQAANAPRWPDQASLSIGPPVSILRL